MQYHLLLTFYAMKKCSCTARLLCKYRSLLLICKLEYAFRGETLFLVIVSFPHLAKSISCIMCCDIEEQDYLMQRYCFFNIHSEDSYETCGPRRGITDVARLFLVRYERYASDEKSDTTKQANNIFHAWYHTEADPVSTLVAKYNGSSEISEVRLL